VKLLTDEALRYSQESMDAKRKIAAIDEKLPELERQKKLAVSTKNFKEAARITADAKTLTTEKERSEREHAALQEVQVSKEKLSHEAAEELREVSEKFSSLEHDQGWLTFLPKATARG